MRECITHFACDCLLAKFDKQEKQIAVMREALTNASEINEFCSYGHHNVCQKVLGALAEAEKMEDV